MDQEISNYITRVLATSDRKLKLRAEGENNVGKDAKECVTILAILLCDLELVKAKLLGFHWNVEGSNFLEYHEFFENLWDDFHGYADLVAERIRQLKEYAPSTLNEFITATRLEDSAQKGSTSEDKFKEILSDFQYLSKWLDEDITIAGEKEDYVSQDILIEIKRKIDKRIWFVESIGK